MASSNTLHLSIRTLLEQRPTHVLSPSHNNHLPDERFSTPTLGFTRPISYIAIQDPTTGSVYRSTRRTKIRSDERNFGSSTLIVR